MILKQLFSILLVLFVVFACTSKAKIAQKVDPLQTLSAEHQSIPVYDTKGLQSYLHQNDEKIHVVNFWATWCGPCVKELPAFEQINAELADEVEVTLVSLDFEEDLQKKLVPFVNKKNIESNVVVVLPESEAEMMNSVSPNWDSGIPATLIYNKNKRYLIEGGLTYDELIKEINKFKS